MSTELEELVTPGIDVTEEGSRQADDQPTPDPKQEEDFLVVSDRQRYKTKEDAIKGISESGRKIAELSQWSKELGQYGVKDPKTAAGLLNELRELRERNANAAKQAESKKVDDTPSYTKEEKDVIKLVEKLAPALGFASKKDLDVIKELQDKLAGFEESTKQSESSRVQSLISDAEDHVSNFLQDAKIESLNKDKQSIVETLLKSWIEADEERVARFMAGGATMKGLIREGTDQAVKLLGWQQATPAQDPSTLAAQNKAKQLKNKTLPVSGSGKKEEQKKGLQNPSGKVRLDDAETMKKAFEVFQANL